MSKTHTNGAASGSGEQRELLREKLAEEGEGLDSFCLSFSQERLWLIDQLNPGCTAYNIGEAIVLRGQLDRAALERSINSIVERHEVLRTTFDVVDAKPVQRIRPALTVPVPVVDLRALPPAGRLEAVRRAAAAEADAPFDLSSGPLLRVALVQLDAAEHAVLFTVHHIASDEWSTGLLVDEVITIYSALVRGLAPRLPALPIQYADYAVWQRQWMEGPVLAEQVRYWRRKLSGATPLEVPADRPRTAHASFRGTDLRRSFGRKIPRKLKAMAQRENATLFMVLLAAYKVLLWRYTGATDICIATNIANRNRAEVAGLIGFFVNNLLLRTDVSGDPTFTEALGRVRQTCIEAYAHQDLPFEVLLDEINLGRTSSTNPFFSNFFVLHNAPRQELVLPGLEIAPLDLRMTTSPFELLLNMGEDQEGELFATLRYRSELFEPVTADRIVEQLRLVIEAVCEDPGRSISSIAVGGGASRGSLVRGFNDAL